MPEAVAVAGTWRVQWFGSGTMIVTDLTWPHYYVYGPRNDDEDQGVRDRYKVCEDLRDYLNGGTRPAWLDDMYRTSEKHAEGLDHTKITAVGPMYDRDPPNLWWDEEDSQEAKDSRARLMDRLFA